MKKHYSINYWGAFYWGDSFGFNKFYYDNYGQAYDEFLTLRASGVETVFLKDEETGIVLNKAPNADLCE